LAFTDLLVRREDPRGRPYFWIGGETPTGVPDQGTDFGALAADCVSITPQHLDLTAYPALEAMRSWTWQGSKLPENKPESLGETP
jgi:5'-nucleotidase